MAETGYSNDINRLHSLYSLQGGPKGKPVPKYK